MSSAARPTFRRDWHPFRAPSQRVPEWCREADQPSRTACYIGRATSPPAPLRPLASLGVLPGQGWNPRHPWHPWAADLPPHPICPREPKGGGGRRVSWSTTVLVTLAGSPQKHFSTASTPKR